MEQVKNLVRSLVGGIGLEVRWTGRSMRRAFPSGPLAAQSRLLAEQGRRDVVVFDIGTNKGQTARQYRREFPLAEIYCFEPYPTSIAELEELRLVDAKVHVVPKAVGHEPGNATFFVNAQDATNSLMPRPSSARRYFPTAAGPRSTMEVDVIDLDGFVHAAGIPRVDILKFDI